MGRFRRFATIILGVVFLLVAVTMGLVATKSGRDHADAVHKADRRMLQDVVGSLTDQYTLLLAKDLGAATAQPWSLRPGDPADRDRLERLAATSSFLRAGAVIVDLKATLINGYAPGTKLPSIDDPGLVRMAADLQAGLPGLSGVLTSAGRPQVALGVPIVKNGQPAAILVGLADVRTTDLQTYVERMRVSSESNTFVVDSSGLVVMSSDPSLIGHPFPGLPQLTSHGDRAEIVTYDHDGESWTAVFHPMKLGGWITGTTEPTASFFGPLRTDWTRIEILLLGLLLLAGIPLFVLNNQRVSALGQAAQARRDPLTQLPNRAGFQRTLSKVHTAAARDGARTGVVLLDLDSFKEVNDSYGHDVGDELLCAVARRLSRGTRPDDHLARLGGDEFGVILRDIHSENEALAVAGRLLATLDTPFRIGDADIVVRASCGVALCDGADGADDVLRDADLAMYAAKDDGGGRCRAFEVSMAIAARDRLEIERDLRLALDSPDQLSVHYQPIADLNTGRLRAVEALVRWNHPTRGPIAPNLFVPVAEGSDLICDMDRWVRRTALIQLGMWQRALPEHAQLAININVSRRELRSGESFAAEVASDLEYAGVAPEHLTLELTENVVIDDADTVLPTLEALDRLGVQLAMDDFGTGHSTLSHLRAFPIRVLKLDKSFVDGVADVQADQAMIRSLLSLANDLGMSVTAEGIESQQQMESLRDLGCPNGQGFHLARPLPASELEVLLTQRDRRAAGVRGR